MPKPALPPAEFFLRNPAKTLGWVLLFFAVTFSLTVRYRLLDCPLERDEGEYAYAGQLLLHGIPPYRFAYNMKLPGSYAAYAVLMALFGQTPSGIHLGLALVNLATVGLIFGMTRNLFGPLPAGFSALAYSILSASPAVLGMAAHATHFLAFFGVAGIWLLWREVPSGRPLRLFGIGLLLGLVFVMKQQGLFLPLFGGIWILLECFNGKLDSLRRPLPVLAAFSAGVVLPFLCICFWLWKAGVFTSFWFWTFQYAVQYVSEEAFLPGLKTFWINLQSVIRPNWTLWLLAAIGLGKLAILKDGEKGLRPYLLGFLLFSFLCLCPGFYFREHYFIALLPAVALFAGLGLKALLDPMGKGAAPLVGRNNGVPIAPAMGQGKNEPLTTKPRVGFFSAPQIFFCPILLAAAMAWPVWRQRGLFFILPPGGFCREVYAANPFPECRLMANYIQSNTTPEQKIAVLGSEPEVYFYSGRLSATGYIYTYGLTEHQPFASKMRQEMESEMEISNPEYILWVNVYTSWLQEADPDLTVLSWAQSYLGKNYGKVGVADILSSVKTEYKWGREAESYKPLSPFYVVLYKRNATGLKPITKK